MAAQLAMKKMGRKRSVSTGEAPESYKRIKTARGRANSLDLTPQRSISCPLPSASSATLPLDNPTVNRRLLTDLILTLNQSFPDYDFADATAEDFTVCSLQTAVTRINERLGELAVQRDDQNCDNAACFLSNLWTAVDKVISLHQVSAVYSYQPSTDCSDPLSFLKQTLLQDSTYSTRQGTDNRDAVDVVADVDYYDDEDDPEGATMEQPEGKVLWTFNYFFVNKHAKRILLFTCIETMRSCYQYSASNTTIPEHEVVNHDGTLLSSSAKAYYHLKSSSASVQSMDSDAMSSRIRDDDDDDNSSAVSIDFDLDPECVSGGIPIGTA
jgi:Maf1 regulator